MSSSLSQASKNDGWADTTKYSPRDEYGPGPVGYDFVPIVSLNSILRSISNEINITLLKVDTQGYDFSIIMSACSTQMKRVSKIISETYVGDANDKLYVDVHNDLYKDWIPYMKNIGFVLSNPPNSNSKREYDAVWLRM